MWRIILIALVLYKVRCTFVTFPASLFSAFPPPHLLLSVWDRRFSACCSKTGNRMHTRTHGAINPSYAAPGMMSMSSPITRSAIMCSPLSFSLNPYCFTSLSAASPCVSLCDWARAGPAQVVRACVRACMRACVRACVCARKRVITLTHSQTQREAAQLAKCQWHSYVNTHLCKDNAQLKPMQMAWRGNAASTV